MRIKLLSIVRDTNSKWLFDINYVYNNQYPLLRIPRQQQQPYYNIRPLNDYLNCDQLLFK